MKLIRRKLQSVIVEEEDGTFTAFEMKWNPKKASTALPSLFAKTYSL